MTNVPRLEDDFATHQGCVRSANEDSLICRPRERVWAVADGMGGHENGQYASQTLIRAIELATVPENFDSACEALTDAIGSANDRLFAEAQTLGGQMGSTIVSLAIRARQFAILWIGDSRAYLYRDRTLRQLTRDHTQVQEMLDRGLIDATAAESHPMGHVLARAVGVQPAVVTDMVSGPIEIGDVFLLCSDGLHGVLAKEEISRILENPDYENAEKLVKSCLDRGAPDNVTAMIVRVLEPTILAFTGNQEPN